MLSRFILSCLFLAGIVIPSYSQTVNIILGRPTDTSITLSLLSDKNIDYYIQYGNQSGQYSSTTTVFNATANAPIETTLSNLTGNTQYFYKLFYRLTGSGSYAALSENNFHTQRAQGSNFTFDIEADEHLYDKKGVLNMYNVTLANEANDKPDFLITLGDIFGDDHYPNTITQAQVDSLHKYYRPLLGNICNSIPLFVSPGNHEGENSYYLAQTPPNNLAVWATLSRKKYYPNPNPNAFYSGNTSTESYGIGNPQDYYAWTWGDALFVVIDVYRYESASSAKPGNWDWTLGYTQYQWLENTLKNSNAKFKFVFSHHNRGQGRGGTVPAKNFEWGGYEADNVTYTFAANRPGWDMPIQQLFKTYGVNVFFQGHDHLFAQETLDNVIYQEVPMAADSTYEIGMLANADAYTANQLDGTGHIRVSVTSSCVKIDFVRAYLPADTLSGAHHNREVPFTYTVGTCTTCTPQVFYKDSDGDGYGSVIDTVHACSAPTGYVSNGLDCNDANANIHPGVLEICNGIDDNCNGIIDDSVIVATITPSGSASVCSNSSIVLSANTGSGIFYQWQKNGRNISGATAATYTSKTAGTFRVNETITGGCSDTSSSTVLSIVSAPAATITPQGSLNICATGSVTLQANSGTGYTYQWLKGSNPITGATSQNYTATTAGNYKVIVTLNNTCNNTSTVAKVTKSGCLTAGAGLDPIASVPVSNALTIFPNPTNGKLNIKTKIPVEQYFSIEVFDQFGKSVYFFEDEADDGTVSSQIDISKFPAGEYLVKFIHGKSIETRQVILTH